MQEASRARARSEDAGATAGPEPQAAPWDAGRGEGPHGLLMVAAPVVPSVSIEVGEFYLVLVIRVCNRLQ